MPFVTYKSSAGSGKTFTLVREYIKLCISKPEQFKRILAITFTNKAANEMKERVITYLTQLSSSETNSIAYKFLLPEIISDTKLSEKEICSRAKQVLDSILHNYSDFAIGTIDSFVHRIIRIFAHDLKIPLNFEVEMDTDRMLSEAVGLLISKAGSDAQLTKILIEFSESKADEGKSWNIENELINFAKQFIRDDNSLHIENVRKLSIPDFLNIRKKLLALSEIFEKSISKIALDALKIINENNIPLESFYHGKSGLGKYLEKLSNGIYDKIQPNSYVLATLNDDKWYSEKCKPNIKTSIDSIKGTLASECFKIIALIEKNFKKYTLYNLVLSNIYPVAVLSEIEKVIDEIKKENNILPISEFNEKISKIVVTQPVPFIYERIGEKYQNYLIDEFQDTSALQWINLLPLIENSLASDYFNLIVGDGKQAIYRWRGGDVEQFAMLPEISKNISDYFSLERAEAIGRNYNEKFLTSNFRSKAELVNFNNKLFKHISEITSPYIQNIYSHCEQEFDKNNSGGYVQINFLETPADDEEQDYSSVTNNKIFNTIEQLRSGNYNFSDIAILCRKKKDASDTAKFLVSSNIPVISDESLLISTSTDVNFLLAFAELAVNRNNNIALYRILHYLLENKMLNDNNMFELTSKLHNENKNIFFQNVHDYLKSNNFIYDFQKLASMAVFEFFKELILIFKINLTDNPYIQFFLDATLEYSSTGKNSLNTFLEWWDDEKAKRSVIIPEGTDAVRIMTIHKSKGLEFPVVIYPYAYVSSNTFNDFIWIQLEIEQIPEMKSALIRNSKKLDDTDFAEIRQNETDKTLLDNLNILYVALTRASEQLYILTKKPSGDISETRNYPEYFASFLHQSETWNDEVSEYSFGTFSKKEVSKKSKGNFKPVPLIEYSKKHREQTIHLRKKSVEIWDTENPEKNIEWGNTVHYVLSKIISANDIEKVIFEIKESGFIEADKIDELKEKIHSIITHPLLSEYYKTGVNALNESEILMTEGNILRPDRIVLENKNAIIIDYKTGSKKDFHAEQINGYAEALKKMGFQDIRKLLVYVNNNQVEEIF